jgi:hypothetical protein
MRVRTSYTAHRPIICINVLVRNCSYELLNAIALSYRINYFILEGSMVNVICHKIRVSMSSVSSLYTIIIIHKTPLMYVHRPTCMYTCIYTYMYVCVCVCVCVYIYIYIYIYLLYKWPHAWFLIVIVKRDHSVISIVIRHKDANYIVRILLHRLLVIIIIIVKYY